MIFSTFFLQNLAQDSTCLEWRRVDIAAALATVRGPEDRMRLFWSLSNTILSIQPVVKFLVETRTEESRAYVSQGSYTNSSTISESEKYYEENLSLKQG